MSAGDVSARAEYARQAAQMRGRGAETRKIQQDIKTNARFQREMKEVLGLAATASSGRLSQAIQLDTSNISSKIKSQATNLGVASSGDIQNLSSYIKELNSLLGDLRMYDSLMVNIAATNQNLVNSTLKKKVKNNSSGMEFIDISPKGRTSVSALAQKVKRLEGLQATLPKGKITRGAPVSYINTLTGKKETVSMSTLLDGISSSLEEIIGEVGKTAIDGLVNKTIEDDFLKPLIASFGGKLRRTGSRDMQAPTTPPASTGVVNVISTEHGVRVGLNISSSGGLQKGVIKTKGVKFQNQSYSTVMNHAFVLGKQMDYLYANSIVHGMDNGSDIMSIRRYVAAKSIGNSLSTIRGGAFFTVYANKLLSIDEYLLEIGRGSEVGMPTISTTSKIAGNRRYNTAYERSLAIRAAVLGLRTNLTKGF